MLQVPVSPVPSISISFAPHELPPIEPKSLFASSLPEEPDSPRPQHLLPPSPLSPSQSIRRERHGQLSPLGSSSGGGKGLERERFEAMLKASKERSAIVGAKKPVELRKEIAMKAQKAKQCERRARFLSKLVAPPSPTAADVPVTPPDSPAVFHFSLPSPGLVSPLELFEDLANHPELYDFKTTIEQVDFRLPQQKRASEVAHQRRVAAAGAIQVKPLPSLDQISQRMSRSPVQISTVRSPPAEQGHNRLPSFLRSRTPSSVAVAPSPSVTYSPEIDAAKQLCPASSTPGLRAQAKPVDAALRTLTPRMPVAAAMPPSPKSPRLTRLQITTTICPPTRSKSSPTEFTEANITEFGTTSSTIPKGAVAPLVIDKSRDQTRRLEASKDLFRKLGRRTTGLPGAAACGIRAQDDMLLSSTGGEDKLKRRRTAPAEMSAAQRAARHPVLSKPGGF